MPEIRDYLVYNDRMRRSMWDKAFFMDKIPRAELIVDFGCADGSLIRFLHTMFPSVMFIGYDIDPRMVEAANAEKSENTWFFASIDQVLRQVENLELCGDRIAVNFSSVLHEVFHYSDGHSAVAEFIGALKPRYIVARDMMYISGDDGAKVSEAVLDRLRQRLPQWQVSDFENRWGSVALRKNLIHLLLKYKYTENWPRECDENYFSYTWDDLMAAADPEGNYRPILHSRYILPWCRYDIEETLGIDPGSEVTTHYALILERKTRDLLTLDAK